MCRLALFSLPAVDVFVCLFLLLHSTQLPYNSFSSDGSFVSPTLSHSFLHSHLSSPLLSPQYILICSDIISMVPIVPQENKSMCIDFLINQNKHNIHLKHLDTTSSVEPLSDKREKKIIQSLKQSMKYIS